MSEDSALAFVLVRIPEIWTKTLEHLFLTGVSIGIAVAVGVPVGIWLTRTRTLRTFVLGAIGVIQTIPSLALLAFLLPFFGIGAQPAIVALTLYALLPIVRNTFTGVEGVPAATLEAAEGMGFRNAQRLWMVELPLAVPVIVAGIRTSAVICVGIATLSTFIGAGGLGDFINRGLALSNLPLILLGAISAAILALLIDALLALTEEYLRPGRKSPRLKFKALLFAAVLLLLGGSMGWAVLNAKSGEGTGKAPASGEVHIGTKNFTEQFILGEMMAQMIELHTPLHVRRTFNLGGTVICHQALTQGEIDLYPEYTGTGLTAVLDRGVPEDPDRVLGIVRKEYRERFDCVWLEPFGFNNTYAITVRRSDAEKFQWEAVGDLEEKASELRAGFTSEFLERPDGYPGFREKYGFSLGAVRDMGPELMYQAVAQGEVDVICAFATDGRIPAYDLKALADDRKYFPPYHAAPVVRQDVLSEFPSIGRVLGQLAGTLDNATMQELNYDVDEKQRDPAAVARDFLRSRGLIPE